VFARTPAVLGSTDAWLDDPDVRDVPCEGERLLAGQPVCTVLASGRDADDCREALARRAEEIYDVLRAPHR
jgi:predicted ATP-grasp superfamily ATP-dependent carboligase